MDDSDLDFADLCSKLLKRVRKKETVGSGDERRKEASQNHTQNTAPVPSQSKDPVRRRKPKQDAELGSRKHLDCRSVSASQLSHPARKESTGQRCVTEALAVSVAAPQTSSYQAAVECGAVGLGLGASQNGNVNLRAKEKVVHRMQQFRWVSPQKMSHVENDQPRRTALDAEDTTPLPAVPQAVDSLQGPLEDEAVALRLQEELDREAQGPKELVDLEQGGLFFCQICQKDLSAMSPQRRTQHINRCLDEGEGSGPSAPAPPAVPECPICGKTFKSQKSRAGHLKRCSAQMGVAPGVLLQALQRQAAETDSAANQPPQAGGSKRKGSSDPERPPKKRQRKKAPPLDDDTMVALALSRSMVEQEREREREMEALLTLPAAEALGPSLQRADTGKRRGKKKGRPPSPPPLLLVQDPGEALRRLQDRVSALLLRARPPTPPTPPRPASRLPCWSGAAPLWQKSALHDGEPVSAGEFYTPALCPPVQPWTAQETQKVAPLAQAEALPPPEPPRSAASTPGQAPSTPLPTPSTPGLGTQTLGVLMDLAEEGLTLTQWGYAPKPHSAPTPGPTQDKDASVADLRLSGFLPERPPTAGGAKNTVALSRLTADLSSMVNNPQLSDVQLQVDSGEVFFAHSFMLYARCPLLVHMVHDSGFSVEEEGMPSAQRVLLGDVPPEAVHVLLQYLYCARCPLRPALVPHLQELAIRLDLRELEQVCHSYTVEPWAESREQEQRDEEEEEECAEQKFLELLRSMWEEQEEEEEGGGGGDGEGEEVEGGAEGRVDEEELLEIYQFAATQRNTEEEEERGNAGTETEEEQEHGFSPVQTASPRELASHRRSNCLSAHSGASVDDFPAWLSTGHVTQERSEVKRAAPIITDGHSATEWAGPDGTSQLSPGQRPNSSLDRSYDHLFSQTWGDYMESSRSQGALIDLSISPVPQPCGSAFPSTGASPGASPGSVRGESVSPRTPREQALKPESRGCSQITISISPHTPREQALKPESGGCSQISISPHTPREETLMPDSRGCSQISISPHMPREQALKPESRGCSQISISPHTPREETLMPDSRGCSLISQMRREPELIVLFDSGEELDVDTGNVAAGAEGPSPPPHLSPVPAGDAGGAGFGPGDAAGFGFGLRSSPVDGGLGEGSPEDMSWLVPGTPEPPARSTRVSSTQAHCSMRRTRLFATPRSSSCSPSPSLTTTVSGPPLPVRPAESRESAVPSARPPICLSPTTPSTVPDSAPANDLSSPALAFAAPPTPPRQSRAPSLALSHAFPRPTSSTPLPPQTAPSAPVPKRGERYPDPVRSSAGSSSAGSPGLWGSSSSSPRKRSSEGGCFSEREDKRGEERMEGGAEEEDPPMAFDESWGLDGGGGPSLHFSLRLDSSAGATQSEQGSGETTPPAPPPPPPLTPQPDNHAGPYTSLLDSKVWDDWEEEEDGSSLPLSQRVQPMAAAQRVRQLKTPVASHRKGHAPLVPITPMPGYSDMDTPDLKNRLNRFGVRPLPKRQMVLKLKEIHQYTHQLLSSESEEDGPAPKPHPSSASTAFKQPERPAPVEAWSKDSSHKQAGPEEEEGEELSASQGSTASSTAASEDSERSNPELCFPSDSDGSDSEGVTASQAGARGAEKLQAVRRFILSDPELYRHVLRYEPLVLSQLQVRLKAHGIRLGTAKLLDFLDSQCITFTTAKPAKPGPPRGRGRGRGRRRGGAAKASE